MQILRATDRVATPWKNGGGFTRAVTAWPPESGLEDFGWRISIADVSRGGPFSLFPGIDRELAILEGTLQLSIDGRNAVMLDANSPAVRFPGDVPTSGEPYGGPVKDLNVMTRRGQFASRMTRLTLNGARSLGDRAGTTIVIALDTMTVAVQGVVHALKVKDAVCLGTQDREVQLVGHPATCMLVEILSAPGAGRKPSARP